MLLEIKISVKPNQRKNPILFFTNIDAYDWSVKYQVTLDNGEIHVHVTDSPDCFATLEAIRFCRLCKFSGPGAPPSDMRYFICEHGEGAKNDVRDFLSIIETAIPQYIGDGSYHKVKLVLEIDDASITLVDTQTGAHATDTEKKQFFEYHQLL